MSAPSQAENAVLFYEKRSGQYDFTWHNDFTKRFSEYLDIQPGQHVLDLACGTGLLTLLEAERVGPTGKAIGVDITPGMLKQANAKKEAGGDKYAHVDFYQGDILDLESVEGVKGQLFDVITVASALVLLPDPKAAIRYWAKFLNPGGVLAADSTHPRNLVSGIILERTSRRLDLPKPFFREWSTSEHALREVLESGGLEVEKIVTIENQSGYGKRYYEDSDWDDHFVEKVIVGDVSRTFADHETRKKAQVIFKEEWEKLSVNGRIEEVDSVFLGIARKPLEAASSEPAFTGGCRCRKVRYLSTASLENLTLCYCRACQHLSGSSYLPFGHVPRYALKFTASSTLQSLKLSQAGERTFCSSCGSPISMVYAFEPDGTGIVMGSIDPGSLRGEWPRVQKHIFVGEKAPWTVIPDDGAQRHETSSVAHLIEVYAEPK